MTTAQKVAKATPRQTHAIYEALKSGWNRETGTYNEGWSDDAIAKSTGAPLASVSRIRLADFGRIRAVQEPKPNDAAWIAVTERLQADIDNLQAANIRLAARLATVEEWIEREFSVKLGDDR